MVGRSVRLLGVAWLCGFVVWGTLHECVDGVCEIVVSGLGRGFQCASWFAAEQVILGDAYVRGSGVC